MILVRQVSEVLTQPSTVCWEFAVFICTLDLSRNQWISSKSLLTKPMGWQPESRHCSYDEVCWFVRIAFALFLVCLVVCCSTSPKLTGVRQSIFQDFTEALWFAIFAILVMITSFKRTTITYVSECSFLIFLLNIFFCLRHGYGSSSWRSIFSSIMVVVFTGLFLCKIFDYRSSVQSLKRSKFKV